MAGMGLDFDHLGCFYPINRSDKYPRALLVNFSGLRRETLVQYVKSHGLMIRPDSTHAEMAVAVARHFDSRTKVDEEGCVARFMNAVRRSPSAAEGVRQKRRANAPEARERRAAEAETARSRRGDGEAALPALPSARRDREEEDDSDDSDGDAETFCVCKRPSYGEMVACDNPDCKVEWFHIGCVGRTSVPGPQEKWFCSDCHPSDSEDDSGHKGSRSAQRKRKLASRSRKVK